MGSNYIKADKIDGKQIRPDSVVISEIIKQIVPLLKDGYTFGEIVDLMPNQGKTNAQIRGYVRQAAKQILEHNKRDIDIARLEYMTSLREDMRLFKSKAEVAANDRDAQAWYKLYIEIKTKIASLFPNELRMEEDIEELKISLNFRPAKQSDRIGEDEE